ncbi:hypothetical protein [Zhihengliuella halotolerans]|uniref:hypothetical protein n=1 Tax=Zhihengliuella halotolerans TaxID=370736 RepID=UPI000C8035D4|nr:hypothetical protein [Zhihengliuella halotolerans]
MSTNPSLTTTRGRIERAERALRTGQPELAMTYMRAARNQIRDDKVARFAEAFAAEAVSIAVQAIGEFGRAAGEAFRSLGESIGQALQGERQSDYVLAAGRSA